MSAPRYSTAALTDLAAGLLTAAGLDGDKAGAVAAILVEGDLMGHTTHGLALLAPYLAELESGSMTRDGGPDVVQDVAAAVTWDGRRLPGPWLVLQAMAVATARAKQYGTGTVVIRRSHHIACLAAYLKRATDQGLLMVLTCSDPNSASVAPFGGLDPVFTPNPLSAGIPTPGEPVLVDISTSATTNGLTNRLHKEGARLPAPWVIDGHGQPSDDPAALFREPKGTILPLGGMDSGHKGYGLSLLVEALTGALAGHGRADPREGWGATVFLQILDPDAFSGSGAFTRQTGAVVDQCHAARPAQSGKAVRMPGEKGLANAKEQRDAGVELYPGILASLAPWCSKFGIPMPSAQIHPTAAALLAFWREAGATKWFKKDPSFDDDFRKRFLAAHESAARGELDGWAETADGALALLLLLDQLPRNAFCGTSRMFATDALALPLAHRAIAAGFDQQIDTGLRNFLYLPLMHSESLPDQQRAVALTQPLGAEPQRFAVMHRDIIEKFGRFPHRNSVLGRATTAAEQAFMDEGGFAG